MKPNEPLQLLGGISPAEFMAKYWQKKPLLIHNAVPDFKPLLSRAELFELAEQEGVESRLIVSNGAKWAMSHGPMQRKSLPALKKPNWTLLVQGVDLHDAKVNALKNQFRFAPDARLDDLMISFATDGGGVGPHFDSYDVFLLQAFGTRRWRIGKQKDLTLQQGVPLKILSNFVAEREYELQPGDMLYLPPRYAHDGIAVGECMTYSIGFKVPNQNDLGREMLLRFADDTQSDAEPDEPHSPLPADLYRDATQEAVEHPAQIPASLMDFAKQAVARALSDPDALARSLGEYLTEPKANVWFDEPHESAVLNRQNRVELSLRSQMMYDARHIFLNGESWRAAGNDAKLMRRLADQRFLEARDLAKASEAALALLQEWMSAGWLT
ncbi:MAG: cupin domain-containing protein [Burkholderiaceae bacterium]|nr:cupin domain-containing protein [Burkholderiaceae bacterium]